MHRIEIVVNSHCDLNCKYCNRHASVCPPTDIYHPDDVRNDLRHLLSLGHKFDAICFTGGEPTINRYFWDYLNVAHELNIGVICVATNGKYLARASDDVLDKLVSNKVSLIISVYPELSRIDYDSLFAKLNAKHIPFIKRTFTYFKNYNDNKRRYLMLKLRLSEKERDLTYVKCFQQMYNCGELQHGIFYKCGVMCNLKAESEFKAANLENYNNKIWDVDDDTYLEEINGKFISRDDFLESRYQEFTNGYRNKEHQWVNLDGGYGYAQYTAYDKKEMLYNYAEEWFARGGPGEKYRFNIADPKMQANFVVYLLESEKYKKMDEKIRKAPTIPDACYIWLKKYEVPKDPYKDNYYTLSFKRAAAAEEIRDFCTKGGTVNVNRPAAEESADEEASEE